MATTGTYNFNPSAGDLILSAFGLGCQLRRYELTTGHLTDALMCATMTMVDFSNRNPNRWAMETQDVPLLAGVPTYNLTPRTLAIAIAYIDKDNSANPPVPISRVIGPLSATDYAAVPNKSTQGWPTSYFFSLLTPIPTVTLWPTPDANGPYTLRLQTFRQMQDVALGGGVTMDAPYRFLDALLHGIASRLARYYPPKDPGQADKLDMLYQAKFQLAASMDQESTPMYVRPQMRNYFR